MSKLERIDAHSAGDAPNRVVVSLSDDRKIIRPRWQGAASSRKAALQSCDTTAEPKVIRLRPRFRREPGLGRWDAMAGSPVPDLRKYESASETDDDYRQRMRTNFLGVAVVIVLMIAGDWVVTTLVAQTRGDQACYRPGQSSCAAVYVPNRQHG